MMLDGEELSGILVRRRSSIKFRPWIDMVHASEGLDYKILGALRSDPEGAFTGNASI
jgi:hypothetical protein